MPAATGSEPSSGNVQSVDRALTVLSLLAADGDLGVTEIAGMLNVHKSTAFRLIATLENHGLVEQVSPGGRYRLGVGILRLAGATQGRLDLVRESRPVTEPLADAAGETVNLVILSGTETLYVDQIVGPSALQTHNWMGHRNPLHATANGRVLLSFLDDESLTGQLANLTQNGRLPALTQHTITDPAVLRAELAKIKTVGFAVAVDELEEGLTAVAAPIRRADSKVVASISVSGPSFRLAPVRVEEVVRLTVKAAAEISARMGYLPPQLARTGKLGLGPLQVSPAQAG